MVDWERGVGWIGVELERSGVGLVDYSRVEWNRVGVVWSRIV